MTQPFSKLATALRRGWTPAIPPPQLGAVGKEQLAPLVAVHPVVAMLRRHPAPHGLNHDLVRIAHVALLA